MKKGTQTCTKGSNTNRTRNVVNQKWQPFMNSIWALSKWRRREFFLCLLSKRFTSPFAIGWRERVLSETVKTVTRILPLSFRTFVIHLAHPSSIPVDFLILFFMESIFSTVANTVMAEALRRSICLYTSHTQHTKNNFALEQLSWKSIPANVWLYFHILGYGTCSS